jgi:SAM-dependent methyltransferase
MKNDPIPQFNFGENWKSFSESALTPAGIDEAKRDFADLVQGIDLREHSFVDIGFGQGLSLLIATLMGAETVGCDINPLCAEVLQTNQRRFFPELADRPVPLVVGSILDDEIVARLRATAPDQAAQSYDVVHSWGVLHSTGDMDRAVRLAASLVKPGGYFIIAIYARHWSSGPWTSIKRLYNSSSRAIQSALVAILTPVIVVAKWLVTWANPFKQTRGMNFHYDVVDWVGGYPYEYATVDEMKKFVEPLGFRLERVIPTIVPTGCNQFVFRSQRT